jgi:membrane-associated protease RseP (regulator of RpoE activity)
VVSRIKGMRVSLPYFIPIPPLGFTLGTLGAFIRMDSPVKDRKGFFDVGLAGPLAGLLIAIPVYILGLRGSDIVSIELLRSPNVINLGDSILTQILQFIAVGPLAAQQTIRLNSVAFAGWLGLFLTGMNLLPAGQLDGGHVAYALFGRAYAYIANLTLLALLGIGFFLQQTQWFFWAFFIMLSGPSHPRPLNDISGLDGARVLIGAFSILLLFLLITPQPFS